MPLIHVYILLWEIRGETTRKLRLRDICDRLNVMCNLKYAIYTMKKTYTVNSTSEPLVLMVGTPTVTVHTGSHSQIADNTTSPG